MRKHLLATSHSPLSCVERPEVSTSVIEARHGAVCFSGDVGSRQSQPGREKTTGAAAASGVSGKKAPAVSPTDPVSEAPPNYLYTCYFTRKTLLRLK